jgi:hypothetical protein
LNIKYIEKNISTYITPGEVPIIKYRIFDDYPELIAGFSTRLGGVSREHLSSMNLSFSRGDERENVIKNHELFAGALGYDFKRLVFSDQVHDVKIKNVTEEDAGKGITVKTDIEGVDGLVTDVPGVPLITFYADCVPLYFYDPVKKVVALAHSGWRGTVKKIGAVMVQRMVDDYGSKPADIVCAIGPSICRSCYEVSIDVAEEFKSAYSDEAYTKIIDVKGNGKFQLDLHLACFYNFISAGISKEHIAMPDICTCCNSDMLFSHRASGGKRGNLAAVAMLR